MACVRPTATTGGGAGAQAPGAGAPSATTQPQALSYCMQRRCLLFLLALFALLVIALIESGARARP